MKEWLKCGVIAACVALASGGTSARSQTAADPSDQTASQVQGLFKDDDGVTWCGGKCGPDQTCCRIVVILPE